MKYKVRTTILSLAMLASLIVIPANGVAADTATLTYMLGYGSATSNNLGRSVAYGDVNGDGYKDIVSGAVGTSGSPYGLLNIYWGTASGINTTPTAIVASYDGSNSNQGWNLGFSLTCKDLNADGCADIIAGSPGLGGSWMGGVVIYYGQTTDPGYNTTPVKLTNAAGGYGINQGYWVKCGDVNGDGYPDVLAGAKSSGFLDVWNGSASGIATTSTADTILTGLAINSGAVSCFDCDDVNNDGYDDLVACNSSSKVVYVYYGSSSGLTTASATTYSGSTVACGDVNNDGYADAIIGFTSLISVYLGSSSGLAATASTTMAVSTPTFLTCGDINNDGYADIIYGYNGTLSFYAGSAAGVSTYSCAKLIYPSASKFGLAAVCGDINADGSNDFIVGAPNANYQPGAVYVFLALPAVATEAAGVNGAVATLNGNLTNMGTTSSVNVYFKYGTSADSLSNTTTAQSVSAAGAFSDTISAGGTYYYQAVASSTDGTENAYGAIQSVTLPYSITTSVPDGHGTAIASPATAASGASSVITLSPDEGYYLAAITDNGTDVIGSVVSNTYTISDITTDHTVVVTFSNTYTVTFVSDGSTYTTESGALSSTIDAPIAPTKNGAAFAGWYSDEALTNAASFPYTVTGNTTLYAKWMVWDLNGDQTCDVSDLVAIGLRWGQTGTPGWIAEDVNRDGMIDVADLVAIGLHWGESYT